MSKFCQNCGNPIHEGESFCSNCGTTVNLEQNTVEQLNMNNSAVDQKDSKGNTSMVLRYYWIICCRYYFRNYSSCSGKSK